MAIGFPKNPLQEECVYHCSYGDASYVELRSLRCFCDRCVQRLAVFKHLFLQSMRNHNTVKLSTIAATAEGYEIDISCVLDVSLRNKRLAVNDEVGIN